MKIGDLVRRVRDGDRGALARLISLLESEEVAEFGDSPPQRRRRVGITGPPGVGKSTLIGQLISRLRSQGHTVAVLAVDPSSPLTGGALLGDRIRMQVHVDDPDVFIRSMATRGHLGGLSASAAQAILAMEVAKFDYVLVETAGVGQSEVEVMDHVDCVVLVLGPSWGDQIQAEKAGVVEIADVIVINKTDLPGAAEVRRALTQSGVAGERELLNTVATTGDGVDDLVAVIDAATPTRIAK